MNKHSLQEKFLIYKVRQHKDADAFGKLYDYYVDRIFRFIYFKVSSREEAEDLTSEVFLKTWEYINKTTSKIQNFNALIYRVARNAVIDHYRVKSRDLGETDEEQMKKIQDKRNIEEEVNLKITVAGVEKHLSRLKETYREVIVLRYIEELTVPEIAEIMGKNKANVRVLLHRGLQTLKDIAKE